MVDRLCEGLDWLLASLQKRKLAIDLWRSEALLSWPLGVKMWALSKCQWRIREASAV
uniref:Uncharacterized protein n=1 Tax=Hyaloperonospora arabidopsidis (strain Emoy2) TaxID=559515 RepID=M4B9T2_HYAAE